MHNTLKDLLLILILSLIFVGVAIEVKENLPKESDIYISTPTGNHKVKESEFVEFVERSKSE